MFFKKKKKQGAAGCASRLTACFCLFPSSCHSGVQEMAMHGTVLARAQGSSRGPVVLCKPASDLLGTAAQASCDVFSDSVTWQNRAGTICQLDSLGAAAASRPAAGQDHLPAAADVSAASRKLDLEGGPLHDMHIAGTGCTGSKRRRRSPLTARNRRTTDPLPAVPAADRIRSTDGCALAGASSEHPGSSSRDAARRPRRPAPAYWLCATACLWTAVTYGVPLARGNYAPTSSGPFSAARTSCGDVRVVLESSQAPLSGSKGVWHNSDIWPLSTCLN